MPVAKVFTNKMSVDQRRFNEVLGKKYLLLRSISHGFITCCFVL